ncbi:MAG: hypothetical protein GTO63_16025, partial [Anaerolineae bacterium]|nr:hypothetical protein [Anaerolineae bacterium]NIN96335.1 hypothetical protein [Anaerolineae bacterium]
MQYLKTYEEGVLPPLYTPLDLIYHDIQSQLNTISLDTLKRVFNTITGIITPDVVINGETTALASF